MYKNVLLFKKNFDGELKNNSLYDRGVLCDEMFSCQRHPGLPGMPELPSPSQMGTSHMAPQPTLNTNPQSISQCNGVAYNLHEILS